MAMTHIYALTLQSGMERSDTRPCLLPTPAPQTFLPHEPYTIFAVCFAMRIVSIIFQRIN